MNGLDKITARIAEDSKAEIDELIAQAKAEAAEIAAGYDAQAKAEAEKILARGKLAASQREERLASVAQLECRKATLAAKQEVLDEAFEAARKKLTSLPEDQYVSLLTDLVVKASSTARESVIFSPADRARVGKAVVVRANEKLGKSAMLTLSQESRPMDGGFILSGGDTEVNCTFATLVRLQRGALSGEVAKVLFD